MLIKTTPYTSPSGDWIEVRVHSEHQKSTIVLSHANARSLTRGLLKIIGNPEREAAIARISELEAALAAAHASRNSDDPEPADNTDEHYWWKRRQESGLTKSKD